MTRQQRNVKRFMKHFGQDVPKTPTIPDAQTRILRVKLLLEEVLELAQASGIEVSLAGANISSVKTLSFSENNASPDLIKMIDALGDIDYVNQGAGVSFGVDLEPYLKEIHRSNMTKLWRKEDVQQAKDLGYSVKKTPKGYLVKNVDGKVIKSPTYSVANLQEIFDKK